MALIASEKPRDYLAESNHLYNTWRGLRLISAFIGNLAIIPAMIDYELRFNRERIGSGQCIENSGVSMGYRYAEMAMSFFAILLLIPYRYYYRVWYRHLPLTYSQLPTLKKMSLTQVLTVRKKPTFWEYVGGDTLTSIILNLISPYPYLEYQINVTQQRGRSDVTVCYFISEVFYAIMYVRFIILALAVFNFGKFRDSFSLRYCDKYRVPYSATFSLKCYTNEQPFLIVFGLLVIPSILMFGMIMRIFERPFAGYAPVDYEFAGNSFWNAIIVMTTVGYGDIFPSTLMGRISNAFCAFVGGIILPMAFVTVGSILQLKDNEQEAARSIRLSTSAAEAIVAALHFNVYMSKEHYNDDNYSESANKNMSITKQNFPLYKIMREKAMIFRNNRLDMPPDTANVISVYNNMKNNLESVEKNFTQLNDLVNDLIAKKGLKL